MTTQAIIEKFKEHNITIYGTHEKPLFKAKDIGDLLSIAKIRNTIKNLDPEYKILKRAPSAGGPQEQWFLTIEGVKRVLCLSRKPVAVAIAKKANIKVHDKYTPIETSIVIMIQKTFRGEEIIEQYPIGPYRLDMYFPKYKLAIEIDEVAHNSKRTADSSRQNAISEELGCIFLRIPENTDIFQALNHIYTHIIDFNKHV